MSVRLAARGLLALGALVLALGPSLAQEGTEPPVETTDESSPGFASPRAALELFLDAVVERAQKQGDTEGWSDAARLFDLSEYPALQRKVRGKALAEKLIEIWDRVAVLDPARFPDEDDRRLRDRSSWTWEGVPPGNPDLAFSLDFARGADGTWRLDPASVERIEDIYASLRHLPILTGLEPKARSLHERLREWVPLAWQEKGFLLEHWQWLGLLVLVAAGVLLERLISWSFRRFLGGIGEGYRIDKAVLARLGRPTSLFAIMVVLAVGLPALDLPADVLVVADLGVHFVLGLAGIWVAYRFVDLLAWYLAERARATRNTFDDMIVPLVRRTAKIFVVLAGSVWVASRVTDDLWGVFAGLGIGSLAVGFAAKDSIENLFGTFTVLMDKPFQLGDWIKVGDLEGTVAEVGFRSTRIRTFYDSLISVPNSTFIDSEVDNLGARSFRRISTKLGVAYDTPPEKIEAFCEGIRQIVRDHPYTRKDYFQVYLNSFGASALEILLYCFHEAPDWNTELRERHRLFMDIIRLASELGVEFAFPTQTLHLRRADELPDHSDAPQSPDEARYRGRQVGGRIAAEGLAPYGGEKPPPAVVE